MNLTTSELLARVAALEAAGAAVRAEADGLRVRVAELEAADPPPPPGGVPVVEFKRRLAMLVYVLGTKDAEVRQKWDRVLAMLDTFTVVYPDQEPVSSLIDAAVVDQLLSPEAAAALKGG